MLFTPVQIINEEKNQGKRKKELSPDSFLADNSETDFISGILDKHIGKIIPGKTIHFWSFGNFNMMRLIFHILDHIGPSDILLSSYSISPKTISGIINRQEKGLIKSFRLIVDNRVRSISPKPFDMIVRNFDYRCSSIHAKVACIRSASLYVTVISSQNATDNPKAERGTIYTDPDIYEFDYKNLLNVFDNGTM